MSERICDACLRQYTGRDENRSLSDLDDVVCSHYVERIRTNRLYRLEQLVLRALRHLPLTHKPDCTRWFNGYIDLDRQCSCGLEQLAADIDEQIAQCAKKGDDAYAKVLHG